MTRLSVFLLGMTMLAASACDLAPFYRPPATPAPPHFKEDAGWHASDGRRLADQGPWWTLFHDDTLDRLERQSTAGNQNLKAALARYDEARDELAAATAGLLPQINGDADYRREQISRNTRSARSSAALSDRVGALDTTSSSTNGTRRTGSSGRAFNDYLAGADASYDLDLFGRLRNAVKAAGDEATATRYDLTALILETHAEVATAYYTIRAYDAQTDILQRSLTAYQAQLNLVRNRHTGGIAMASDVDQAILQLENARSQLDSARLSRAQAEHALAVLVGESPSAFGLAAAPFNPRLPTLDTGLPSDLLERRPDIAAAERRVAEANAGIGVARAAWFPDFTLSGAVGYESQKLSNLIGAPSLYWSVGPSLTQTIFDGGRIAAQVAEAKAAYREAAATYRQTVLNAYQDIEDNLAGIRQYGMQADHEKAAADAADRSLKQSYLRYRGGIETYLDVTVQQNEALQAELALTTAQLNQVNAYVRLIRGLGGGWRQ